MKFWVEKNVDGDPFHFLAHFASLWIHGGAYVPAGLYPNRVTRRFFLGAEAGCCPSSAYRRLARAAPTHSGADDATRY
jgi:hypothetical protein